MSGEFGGFGGGGYFHQKIDNAMVDASEGREPVTRALGRVLEALYPIARLCSWVEACDSGAVEFADLDLGDLRDAVAGLEQAIAAEDVWP